MKSLIPLFVAFMVALPAYAAPKKDAKSDARDKLKDAKEAYRDAINAYLEPKDTNHDGSISLQEFIADESDKESATKKFEEANKNGDRALTKDEIAVMLGADKDLAAAKKEIKESKQKKK